MGVVDRTQDFHNIIRELTAKGSVPGFEGLRDQTGVHQQQSELNVYSAQIGAEIEAVFVKVQELRKMAKKKDIFNDRSTEIQELTFSVKNGIKDLDSKLEALATKARGNGANRSSQAHSSNMVETLKTRLLEVTKDFKDALEDRTKNMEAQDKRRNMYSANHGGVTNPFAQRHGASSSSSFTGNSADLEGGVASQSGAQAVMYHNSRAEAVQNVQRTIGELAQMFSKMAVMVTSQEDQIKRIDHDLDDTLANMNDGQNDLLKYFHHISSNRMLIIKVFLILISFVIFFVVFLA